MHIMGEHYTLHLQIPLVGDHENHEMLGAQAEKRAEDRDITNQKYKMKMRIPKSLDVIHSMITLS